MFKRLFTLSIRRHFSMKKSPLGLVRNISPVSYDVFRYKHTTSGIQGIRNSKQKVAPKNKLGKESGEENELEDQQTDFNLDDT